MPAPAAGGAYPAGGAPPHAHEELPPARHDAARRRREQAEEARRQALLRKQRPDRAQSAGKGGTGEGVGHSACGTAAAAVSSDAACEEDLENLACELRLVDVRNGS